MDEIDHLALLSLIVALSAYVAGVRLAVIGRISAATKAEDAKKKKQMKWFLKCLVPADIALVFAGILLFLNIFWGDMFGGTAPTWFSKAVVWAFFAAIVMLAIHHLVSWFKSFKA